MTREPLRCAVTIGSIAIGIGVIIAIQLANASSLRGFEAALDAVSGKTSVEIVSPGDGMAEVNFGALGWLREYGLVSPVIEANAWLRPPGASTAGERVRVLGVDILRDQSIRDYKLLKGTRRETITKRAFLALLTDPQTIVITRVFADRHGLGVGGEVEAIIGDRVVRLLITGLLDAVGPATVLDGNFALMDIAGAQFVFDRLGRIDRVDVRLWDAVDVEGAELAIASRLPNGMIVQRPERRGRQVETMLAAFHFNLTALSYIALLVGLFLVYNTVSTSVVKRRAEIGVLRMVGASRRTLLYLFLGEAVSLAFAGCVIGAPLGWVLAQGAVSLTSSTVSKFWIVTAAPVPPLGLEFVALAFVVGVPLAVVAAAVPAAEASRVTPMAAVGNEVELQTRARLNRRFLVGPPVLFGIGAFLSTCEPVNGLPVFGLFAALAVVFGGALSIPMLLHGLRKIPSGVWPPWLRVEADLARGNIGAATGRLAISVGALAMSIAMVVAIAVMVGSFRETVIYWVGQTLQGDLFVSTTESARAAGGIGLSAHVEETIEAHPSVIAIDAFYGVDVAYGDSLVIVGSGRFDVLLQHGNLVFKAPPDGRSAMASAIGRNAVIVSESFSLKYAVGVGETLDLPTPNGSIPMEVVAIFYDYSNDRGLVVMDEGDFTRHFRPPSQTGLTIYLRNGVDPGFVREEILATLGPGHSLFINTNSSVRREVLRVFNSTFAITYALEAIAIFVSVIGVAATLLTLVLERRKEIAAFRLAGAESKHLQRMIMIEAGMLGGVSLGAGLLVGLALSLILIYVVNVQSFGWTIQFHLPVGFLAQASLLMFVTTILSGLYPARLACRFRISELSVDG
jgi:putative ABC transport system permease protein